MNKSTADRYERIGAILTQLRQQNRLSPLERVLIDELLMTDKAFVSAFSVIKSIVSAEDGKTLDEIATALSISYESAKVMVRSLKLGGFEFAESQLETDDGNKGCSLFELDMPDCTLTYLMESKY